MSRGARMTLEQVSRLPQAAQRQIHDQLYSPASPVSLAVAGRTPPSLEAGTPQGSPGPKKRLRQSTKPLLNQLETDFLAHLRGRHPSAELRPQAKRYELARGIWYKPDVTAILEGFEHAWEVKGPKVFRGGLENLKVAARVWPSCYWWLVWKDPATGAWQYQRVLA